MAENYSAQNSITIKRLRSNDSLMLTFENNGIPLFQAVDEESGAVSPAIMSPMRTWSPGSTAISAIMPDIWGLI